MENQSQPACSGPSAEVLQPVRRCGGVVVQKSDNVALCHCYSAVPRTGQPLRFTVAYGDYPRDVRSHALQQIRIVIDDDDDFPREGSLMLH